MLRSEAALSDAARIPFNWQLYQGHGETFSSTIDFLFRIFSLLFCLKLLSLLLADANSGCRRGRVKRFVDSSVVCKYCIKKERYSIDEERQNVTGLKNKSSLAMRCCFWINKSKKRKKNLYKKLSTYEQNDIVNVKNVFDEINGATAVVPRPYPRIGPGYSFSPLCHFFPPPEN